MKHSALCYLNTAKGNARERLEAFAAGSGAEITTRLEFQSGRTAVFWGVDRATIPLWDAVQRSGTPYWYIDNAYLRGAGGPHYRVTYCAEQHNGRGESDGSRFAALGLKILACADAGRDIILATSTDWWHKRHGDVDARSFEKRIRAILSRHTARRVIARAKPIHGRREPPLSEQLHTAHAVIVHASMVGAEAVLAGVPVFALGGAAFDTVAERDLARIESPFYPSPDARLRWASVLADNQWTLAEIARGVPFEQERQ